MPLNDALMPPSDRQELLERLMGAGGYGSEIESRGKTALALLLAHGLPAPDASFQVPGATTPKSWLSATLAALHARKKSEFTRATRAPEPRLVVSLDPADPWPEDITQLPAHERIALWLLRSGADPWHRDDAGRDALDLAVAAQARTLLAALLAHPGCPPLDELKARTTTISGREVPWLHALAYANGMEMFEDLVEAGFDRTQPDRSGWPPAAWANTVDTLQALLDRQSEEDTASQQVALEKAWSRRTTLRLVEDTFKQDQMSQALAARAGMPAQDQAQVALFKAIQPCLAANPAKQPYHYKGVLWANPHGTEARKIEQAALRDLMRAHFDWRFTQKSGTARGCWSLLAAVVWGTVRGERDAAANRALVGVIREILEGQPAAARVAWLDESIRPGLTNRGLVCWALGEQLSSVDRQWVAQGAPAGG